MRKSIGDLSRAFYGLGPYREEELLPDRPEMMRRERDGRSVMRDRRRRRYLVDEGDEYERGERR